MCDTIGITMSNKEKKTRIRKDSYASPIWYCALKVEISTADIHDHIDSFIKSTTECELGTPDCRKCIYRNTFISMIQNLNGVVPRRSEEL